MPAPPPHVPTSPPRKAALAFIFVTIVLDVLAIGVIIPVLPRLIEAFTGSTEKAAVWVGVFGTLFAVLQFFCAPILGSVSDRFGRRPVVLLSCLGLGIDYIVMSLAPGVGWLLLGRSFAGLLTASFATATAYIADVTPAEKRAGAYGMIGAAWGLGFILGPAIGGVLGDVNPRLPFVFAAVLALANAAYGYFVLPESLPAARRTAFSWRRANPLGSLRLLRSHREMLGLACVNLLFWIAHHVLPTVFVLYVGLRYQWSTRTVGLAFAAVGVANVVVQGLLVKPIVRALGERRALLAGALAGAAGFLVYATATTSLWFCAAIPVFAFIGLFGPSLQGLMTRHVGPNEQGQLQGANGSIMALAGLIGPGVFSAVFAWSIAPSRGFEFPGAPFLLASAFLLAAAAIAWRTTRADIVPAKGVGAAPR
ncbi:MAG: TCR/Tet family MFS transporter [Burkholderiales bacterium]